MSEHLTRAAKARHDDAVARATGALRELSVAQLPVTFVAVARRARVSTDFLYRQPTLRASITNMRDGRSGPAPTDPGHDPEANRTTSAAVQALAARLKDLQTRPRTEVAGLQQALAAAHGENLVLRSRLAAIED